MRALLVLFVVPLSAQFLTVSPSSVTVAAGQSVQLTATIGGVSGPAAVSNFSWRISGAQVGTIDQTGLYTAPAAPAASTVTVLATASIQSPGVKIPQLLGSVCVISISMSIGTQGTTGPQGPPGPPGPVQPWKYQEIPAGGYTPSNPPPAKAYGTGYILTLKCSPVSGTIHLWMSGMLLYEGESFYLGSKDPAGSASGLGSNQIAMINIDQGFQRAPGDPNQNCGSAACPVFRVDYQYSPDGTANCP